MFMFFVSSRRGGEGGGVKSLRTGEGGVKNFRTGGGLLLLGVGVSTPLHAIFMMEIFVKIVHG